MVPPETLTQLVFDTLHTFKQQWHRELSAFSTANYRRENLRMFCKWQRETAEVSLQSQRNLSCALPFFTLNFYFHSPTLQRAHLPVPTTAPPSCLRFLIRFFFFFFPSLFGAFEKGNRSGKYFCKFSIHRLIPKPRGRAGADGGNEMLVPKAQFEWPKTVPPFPYPHGPGMTETKKRKTSHLFDYMISQNSA